MTIVYAVLILGVTAIIFGLVLAFAAKIFEVEVDPRLPQIQSALAGANCGGCGYPGCAGCAEAILNGKAPVTACAPAGAEGAAKIGYRPGEGSCGASLSEFARICEEAGMANGVNLDGGGSAQILLDGVRHLRISDRDETEAETERFIPLAIAAG